MRKVLIALVLLGTPLLQAENPTASLDKKDTTIFITPSLAENLEPKQWNSISQYVVDTPVNGLEYHPLVDAQDRGLARLQSDIAIEGGIFENNSVKLGANNLFDPQTGHYLYEIPISSQWLSKAQIDTGVSNAIQGFNNTVGTVGYDFTLMENRGKLNRVGASIGDFWTNSQSANLNTGNLLSDDSLNLEVELTRAESDGTRPRGDNELERGGFHAQYANSDRSFQSDLVISRNNKSFQWPNLYVAQGLHNLIGSAGIESETLQTSLLLYSGSYHYDDSFVNFGAYYRKNYDDYELDVDRPNLFNPYQHTTRVKSVAFDGQHSFGSLFAEYGVNYLEDDIDSTALTFAPYQSRRYLRNNIGLGYDHELCACNGSAMQFRFGVVNANSNETALLASPYVEVKLKDSYRSASLGYLKGSQLPGYTAIGSNSESGLFRGNSNLDAERSDEYYIAASADYDYARFDGKVFYREQSDLTDWTFDPAGPNFAARTAQNIDVDTLGLNLSSSFRLNERNSAKFGYAFLDKDGALEPNFGSFYALNYARHRGIGNWEYGVSENLKGGFLVELRKQENNPLRNSTGTEYALGSPYVKYEAPSFDVTLAVDNVWNENFEEVPGVPGKRRLVVLSGGYKW